jgi:hypothetical protein
MKNLFAFIVVLCLSNVAIAQEAVQNSLVTKVTASWCINCGTWGWMFFENTLEDNGDNATFIAAHYSGDLSTPAGQELADGLGATGQPLFYFGEERLFVSSSNIGTEAAALKALVDENTAKTATANTAIVAGDLVDGKIEMTANTKFFQEAEGEFYLSILLIEDGVVNSQSGQGASAVHKNVLRAAATSSVFGDLLAEGVVPADTEFQTDFVFDLDPSWVETNLSVSFILWNKVNGNFEFVNTATTNALFSITSASEQILDKSTYQLTSNIVDHQTQLTIGMNDAVGNASVQLVNLQGSVVKEYWNGQIETQTSIDINSSNFASGTYLLYIKLGEKYATEKVIFVR